MITIRLVPTAAITAEQNEQLWALYAPSYNVDRAYFEFGKTVFTEYAMIWDRARIVGFTGVSVTEARTERGREIAVGMGQTVLDPAYRDRQLMQRLAAMLAVKFTLRYPGVPKYVWTNAISYKPYLVFSKSLREYYPSRTLETPRYVEQVRDAVLSQRFARFGYQGWTVNPGKVQITETTHTISARDLEDADVRFYLENNPRYLEGSGLFTLTPMTVGNMVHWLTHFARKQLRVLTGRTSPARSRRADPSPA